MPRISLNHAQLNVVDSGSGPKTLRMAGSVADGAFVNFGIAAENLRQSENTVAEGAVAAGRAPDDVETWQIAALDCNEDAAAARFCYRASRTNPAQFTVFAAFHFDFPLYHRRFRIPRDKLVEFTFHFGFPL